MVRKATWANNDASAGNSKRRFSSSDSQEKFTSVTSRFQESELPDLTFKHETAFRFKKHNRNGGEKITWLELLKIIEPQTVAGPSTARDTFIETKRPFKTVSEAVFLELIRRLRASFDAADPQANYSAALTYFGKLGLPQSKELQKRLSEIFNLVEPSSTLPATSLHPAATALTTLPAPPATTSQTATQTHITSKSGLQKGLSEKSDISFYPAIPQWPAFYLAHPFALQANFTGRAEERQFLDYWLSARAEPVLALVALGGTGKSSLVWYWLTEKINQATPTSQLPQAATRGIFWWSFYEGELSFSKFLEEALIYASGRTLDPKILSSDYERLQLLLQFLAERPILFVLDGFERQLSCYATLGAVYKAETAEDTLLTSQKDRSCVDPNLGQFLRSLAAGGTKAKLLMTTRLGASDLEDGQRQPLAGYIRHELGSLHPDEAVAFMRAQGVRGSQQAIVDACAPYGYHALSLRLLSGVIIQDKRHPGDIGALGEISLYDSLVARRYHILQVAYDSLPYETARLLRQIATLRQKASYEVIELLAAYEGVGAVQLNALLQELIDRGLLTQSISEHESATFYDLHPVVRAYAYAKPSQFDKKRIHGHLRDYFKTLCSDRPATTLEELSPLIEFFYHTARGGDFDAAFKFFDSRISSVLFHTLGAYNLRLELQREFFPDGENELPRLSEPQNQIWAMANLGGSYAMIGDPRRCAKRVETALRWARKYSLPLLQAALLGYFFDAQLLLGKLETLQTICTELDELANSTKNQFIVATAHERRATLLSNLARYEEGREVYLQAYDLWSRLKKDITPQETARLISWQKSRLNLYEQRYYLFLAKTSLLAGDFGLAVEEAQVCYKLAAEINTRDVIRAELLLVQARLRNGEKVALKNCESLLVRTRRLNLVEQEPEALLVTALDFASLGDYERAVEVGTQAQILAGRCSYHLLEAEIWVELAEFELGGANFSIKRVSECLSKAGELARCDGFNNQYWPLLSRIEGLRLRLAS